MTNSHWRGHLIYRETKERNSFIQPSKSKQTWQEPISFGHYALHKFDVTIASSNDEEEDFLLQKLTFSYQLIIMNRPAPAVMA